MKVALLLTGQIRTNELCRHIFKKTLIEKYDVDTFLSIDTDNKLQEASLNSTEKTSYDVISNAIEYYNPVDSYVCETYDDLFKEKQQLLDNNLPYDKRYKMILEQYYIVYKAYEMLQLHVNNTGVKYDIVIRLRFDQFIWSDATSTLSKYVMSCGNVKFNNDNINMVSNEVNGNLKIELDSPTNNEICTLGWKVTNTWNDYVNDQFWIHSYALTNLISKFYIDLPDLINTHSYYASKGPFIEVLFYQFLKQNRINVRQSKITGKFCREYTM